MAQSWSSWERGHAVSQHGAFLVIKQPGEGFCYVKQSYDNELSKMELSFQGAAPGIVTPFYRGIDGDVLYWVDDGPRRKVPNAEISGVSSFELAAEVVEEMRAGRTLHVRVTPSGQRVRTQEFSLLGFTAASHELSDAKCQDAREEKLSSNLVVNLRRNVSGVVVSGKTSLPDRMSLMISLRESSGGYYAQDKVQVRNGSFESAAFTNKGRALPSGKYRVSISSPLMDFQPARVTRELGSSGSRIPEDLREKSSYSDSYTVKYSVSLTLE